MDIDFFTATLKVNPDYLYSLMMFFAAELKESEKRMRNLAHMSTKSRIAYALLSLQEKFGVDAAGFLNIVLSRQDLASYTGTTYETLFKMMNEFYNQGMYPLQMMGALVWYWGKEGRALGPQRFERGLKALEEADLNIKRSRLLPEYAIEKLVVELVELQKQ